MNEIPGVLTPWLDLNQLFAPEERFEVNFTTGKSYLFTPKHASQLVALFFLMKEHGIPFCIHEQGKDFSCRHENEILISSRALKNMILHEQDVVEIEAGCTLQEVQQFLYERKLEIPGVESILTTSLTTSKRSMISTLSLARREGLTASHETLSQAILGVDFVARDGNQMQWGSRHRGGVPGPAFHRLIWAMHGFPGMIVRVFCKANPIPESRIRLTWVFSQKRDLLKYFEGLVEFSSSWECLDYVHSANDEGNSYIFAQISELMEEMVAFRQGCPYDNEAKSGNERQKIRLFFEKQKLNVYNTSRDHKLLPGEYLWYQGRDNVAWWLTPQVVEESSQISSWKEFFCGSLL